LRYEPAQEEPLAQRHGLFLLAPGLLGGSILDLDRDPGVLGEHDAIELQGVEDRGRQTRPLAGIAGLQVGHPGLVALFGGHRIHSRQAVGNGLEFVPTRAPNRERFFPPSVFGPELFPTLRRLASLRPPFGRHGSLAPVSDPDS